MTARVVKVQRNDKLTWLERLYVPMILRGLRTTAGHFFRNLGGYLRGKPTTFVVQYPEERVVYPDAFRGQPVLVELEGGLPRCVACGLCEFACPTDCITIVAGELPGAGIERYPEQFEIDMSRCMFCGLCEEACPEEAIVMSTEVEISSFERAGMIFDKKALLVPEALVERRLAFLRAEYDREDEPASPTTTPEEGA